MSNHRSGKKISRRHTTVIESAQPIVDRLKKEIHVTKIVLGPIKSVRSGLQRVKITEVQTGLKIVVRGTASIQTLFVYTKNTQYVKNLIEKLF